MGLFDFLKKKEESSKVEVPKKDDLKIEVSVSREESSPHSLDDLIKGCTPSKNGLYPHEILMLHYADSYKVKGDNHFQGFWKYEYLVEEPQKVLISLYDRGFLENGDLKSVLDRLTIPVLKEELSNLGLKQTGKKGELIDRLLESDAVESLSKKYESQVHYALTDMGKQELQDNEYVLYLHRKKYMSVWNMNKRKAARPELPYRDIIWGYFNEQSLEHIKNYDFGLYRNTRLNMYNFLMEENKHKAAFSMICEVISYDLSGLGNNEKLMFELEKTNPKSFAIILENKIDCSFPYGKGLIFLAPAVTSWLSELQNILELSDELFKDALLKEFTKHKPPRSVFTPDECVDIVIAELKNDESTINTIFGEAEKRERAKLSNYKE